MERRERGFFGKLLVFFLTFFALIGIVAMALCVINPYINPKHFVWTSFFGLAFWVIFTTLYMNTFDLKERFDSL